MNKKFVIIIPSYNNNKWYKKNLDSIFKQNYKNFRVIYIDDCSTDNTYLLVKQYINKYSLQDKITLLKNDKRKFQSYNRYIAFHLCADNEICCMVDGDDWLLHNYVLTVLNDEYNKYDLLCSYGQFKLFENGKLNNQTYGVLDFPTKIIQEKSYRKYDFITYHLRTGYAKLFKKIPEDHLKDENGNWLDRCTDIAESLTVLELSNGRHKNIGYPLYVYNKDNSIKYENSWFSDKLSEKRKSIEKKCRILNIL